jgi:Concanavalin A-like lectin/glucanases superfamily
MTGYVRRSSVRLRPRNLRLDESHPLSHRLVGFWPLGEYRGFDLSRARKHGPAQGFSGSGISGGRAGGAATLFDRVDDYFDLGNYVPTFPFSVAAWVRVNTLDAVGHCIWSMADSALATDRHFLVVDGFNSNKFNCGTTSAAVGSFGTNCALSAASAVANTWYFVVGVWETASKRSLYVNGRFEATSTVSVTPTTPTRTWIGRFADSTPNWEFGGNIEAVRLYSRALSAVEILKLYTEPYAAFEPRKRRLYLVSASPAMRTLSGAFAESNDAAAASAAVKVAGTIARSENADGASAQARLRIAGSIGVQDSADQLAAFGGAGQPLGIDPHYLLLARPVSRRVSPAPRPRFLRAFPRARRLLAA